MAQGSLSPQSGSFEENQLRNSSRHISSRDKSNLQSGEGHFSVFNNLPITSTPTNVEGFIQSEGEGELPQFIAFGAVELLPSTMNLPPQFPLKMGPPVFSPYYYWCPPSTSSVHAPSIYFVSVPSTIHRVTFASTSFLHITFIRIRWVLDSLIAAGSLCNPSITFSPQHTHYSR